MTETEPKSEPERPIEGSPDIPLRRRQQRPVEFERRRSSGVTFDIAAALELYLDQCRTRRAMIHLLEEWLAEARNRGPETQDSSYVHAVERAIDVMNRAPDVQTAIVRLQRR